MLKIQNLTKHFGGVKAVNDCSFQIEKGKITALIGPNGSGKSTIFNCVSGIIKPNTGEILFNSQNITGLSVDDISNKGISRVFQKSQLFKNLTVRENLLLAIDNNDQKFWKNIIGLNKHTSDKEDRIRDLLGRMELLPIINKSANDLSFGQKRLVELARTILNPHGLLMLDEPVAGVNPKIRNFIAEMLIELRDNGTTILLIEHDMNFTLSLSNSIIVLDAGKVIAHGSPEQIKENSRVLEAYLGDK
jgi:ABC-type branched-subunit amino acid transport system ATPase component